MVADVNLIAWNNGVGLTRDLHLVADALQSAGIDVAVTALRRGKLRKWFGPAYVRARAGLRHLAGDMSMHRLNIMFERVRPEYLPLARSNALIPNPEWFLPEDGAHLPSVDRVFVKTVHAEPIFRALGRPVWHVGFTSEDRHDPAVPRERAFFHLAGRSIGKGTEALLTTWRRHPEWPRLTVVQNPRTARPGAPADNIAHRVGYVDAAELRRLQNAHRFHLCPSEAEGFGHYIVEAMSTGAVTLTTDGAPMNELVTAERGLLIPYAHTGTQHLATSYFVDRAGVEAAVERALALSDAECTRLGESARAFYLDNDRRFRERIVAAVGELL